MSNLLLKQTKQKIFWQKRNRLLIMIAIAVLLGSIVVYVAMLPITVYTYVLNKSFATGLTTTQDKNIGKQRKRLREELKNRKRFIDTIRVVYAQSDILPIVSILIKDLSTITDINVTQLDVRHSDVVHTIYMAGNTTDRANMVALRDLLNKYPNLRIIDFPISNFAPNQDGLYQFTIKLEYNKNHE